MEKTNVLTLIITLVVGVILCGALLGPVVNDVTETERTFDNSAYGFYQMKELEAGDSWTRSNGVWTYGGETLTTGTQDNVSIIATENTVFRQSGQVRGTTYGGNVLNTVDVVTVDELDVIKLNTSTTINYTSGYGAVQSGDYILKSYGATAYVHGNTNLWVTGVTGLPDTTSLGNLVIHIEGTINDGVTVTADKVSNGGASNIEISNVVINYEEVTGYDDLYLINTITFDIDADYTVDETTTHKTTNATYSTFVLPKEITAERTGHLTDGQNSLIGAIPIMVIVALLMAAVGAIAIRRAD